MWNNSQNIPSYFIMHIENCEMYTIIIYIYIFFLSKFLNNIYALYLSILLSKTARFLFRLSYTYIRSVINGNHIKLT